MDEYISAQFARLRAFDGRVNALRRKTDGYAIEPSKLDTMVAPLFDELDENLESAKVRQREAMGDDYQRLELVIHWW